MSSIDHRTALDLARCVGEVGSSPHNSQEAGKLHAYMRVVIVLLRAGRNKADPFVQAVKAKVDECNHQGETAREFHRLLC